MKTNLFRLSCYILLLAFTSCKSCKKTPPPTPLETLPIETQTGAGTFGALIDGQPWLPIRTNYAASWPRTGGYISDLSSYLYKNNVWIEVGAPNQGFTIWLRNVDKVGTYPLNFDTAPKPQIFYPQNYASFIKTDTYRTIDEFYTTTSTVTGSVEITKADTTNNIVAGRFSFDAIDRATGKTIKVTNGRFDCKTGL